MREALERLLVKPLQYVARPSTTVAVLGSERTSVVSRRNQEKAETTFFGIRG